MAQRPAHPLAFVGFLTAVIALVSQLAVRVLCDGVAPAGNGDRTDHGHRPLAPAICPISVALALPSVVLTPVPVLPAPKQAAVYVTVLERPPGRGPPPATARVGLPRAPPLSV